ncbi:MAG: hypothetical protein ABSB89_05150 [Candidatus Bathyarchaeia archaeon]
MGTMTHRRTREKEQVRQARRIILSSSFHDRVRCERICRMTRTDVLALLKEPVQVGSVPALERGEVLVDSRGKGSFQTE